MDPVSSAITILQTAADSKHLINLIQSLPEIQKDFEDFQKDLKMIEIMHNIASQRISCNNMKVLIEKQLCELLAEFRAFESQCSHDRNKSGRSKAKRIKWMREEKKIQKLQQKYTQAKSDFVIALILERNDIMPGSNLSNQPMESLPTQQVSLGQQFSATMQLPNQERKINELADDAIAEDSDHSKHEAGQMKPCQESSTNCISSTPRIYDSEHFNENHLIIWDHIAPMTLSGCLGNCQCHCHFRQGQLEMTRWVERFAGGLYLSYGSFPGLKMASCILGCKGSADNHLRMEWQPPKWLGGILPKIHLDWSLRPTKTIEMNENVWFIMNRSQEYFHEFIKSEFQYFPDDQGSNSLGLIESALMSHSWTSLELLLHVWKNLLSSQGLPRNVYFVANHFLEGSDFGERETYLLRQIKELADDGDDTRQTMVHEAVLQGEGVDEAVRCQPWALDRLDRTGRAPIHLAAIYNELGCLEDLINAKADINQKDYSGDTPLMIAATQDHLEAAKCLLIAKCLFNTKNRAGQTALHLAVGYSSPDFVSELLRKGALPDARNILGETPLHALSLSQGSELDVNRKLHLLLATKSDIEARDVYYNTPLIHAMVICNLPAFSCLVEAGASLHKVTNNQNNILHMAAMYSNFETMFYLADQNTLGINHQLSNNDGESPWDVFIWVRQCSPITLASRRRPTLEEEDAFVQFYQKTRNHNLQSWISSFQELGRYIESGNDFLALQALNPLIKQFDDWGQEELLFTSLDIQQHVDNKDWESAKSLINNTIFDLHLKMNTSPWEQRSWRDLDYDREDSTQSYTTDETQSEDLTYETSLDIGTPWANKAASEC